MGKHRLLTSGITLALAASTIVAASPGAGLAANSGRVDRSTKASTGLPLEFEKNQGQTDSQVKFLSRGPAYTLFLTQTEAVMKLSPVATGSASKAAFGSAARPESAVRMRVEGANPRSMARGLKKLPGVTNDLRGSDPAKWHRGIPNFRQVAYKSILPGIDLIFYGKTNGPEYDFIVAPKADPRSITMVFSGAQKMSIDGRGNLVFQTAAGVLRHHKPFIYQLNDGGRKVISGHYALKGSGKVGFSIGAYDSAKALFIDPTLSYNYTVDNSGTSTNGTDVGNAIAVNSSGEAFVTGQTSSTDFPTAAPSGGAVLDSSCGISTSCDTDVTFFPGVTVLGLPTLISVLPIFRGSDIGKTVTGANIPPGTTITGVGGPISPFDRDFFATMSNNATGVGPTTFTIVGRGPAGDAFVTKLNAAGTSKVYSTYLGGEGDDSGQGIALDSSGRAYVTGYTSSDKFPTTQGALQASRRCYIAALAFCSSDAFLAELSPNGSALVYSTYFGGGGGDAGFGVAVDSAGSAFITGVAGHGALLDLDFPTTPGA